MADPPTLATRSFLLSNLRICWDHVQLHFACILFWGQRFGEAWFFSWTPESVNAREIGNWALAESECSSEFLLQDLARFSISAEAFRVSKDKSESRAHTHLAARHYKLRKASIYLRVPTWVPGTVDEFSFTQRSVWKLASKHLSANFIGVYRMVANPSTFIFQSKIPNNPFYHADLKVSLFQYSSLLNMQLTQAWRVSFLLRPAYVIPDSLLSLGFLRLTKPLWLICSRPAGKFPHHGLTPINPPSSLPKTITSKSMLGNDLIFIQYFDDFQGASEPKPIVFPPREPCPIWNQQWANAEFYLLAYEIFLLHRSWIKPSLGHQIQ